ncbi:MAG: Co2+/Mg2+ efflux protein ApaG [Archangiaceae bacterium]|nr:Co2+/Mg2+ efflux protein ApaG [Archangiaceae bacterium]
MSNTITEGIRVQVKATFWPERSNVEGGQWAFSYAITISNEGSAPATLRTRHWLITDATGSVEEVRGPGVVGKQPRLEPGERFEYQSWAMLKTPFGSMRGSYQMEREDKTVFDARISEFALTQPNALN